MSGRVTDHEPTGYHLGDFNPRDRVVFVPLHAKGSLAHPDCERGSVSSINEKYVFVKFDRQVSKFGWDGATSQSCDPSSLIKEN